MQVLTAKRQEENCTGRYSNGLRNQNGEHLYESNKFETQTLISTAYSELARTLFPVLKVQIT